MTVSPLRQVLNYFENSQGAVSLFTIAGEMHISSGQVESMVQFWVRKGRLRVFAPSECGSCGLKGECNNFSGLPRIYEFVREGDQQETFSEPIACCHS